MSDAFSFCSRAYPQGNSLRQVLWHHLISKLNSTDTRAHCTMRCAWLFSKHIWSPPCNFEHRYCVSHTSKIEVLNSQPISTGCLITSILEDNAFGYRFFQEDRKHPFPQLKLTLSPYDAGSFLTCHVVPCYLDVLLIEEAHWLFALFSCCYYCVLICA